MDEPGLVRVGTRVGKETNEWLDNESKKTGLSKSALVMLAIEQYKHQKSTMDNGLQMMEFYRELEELKQKVED